MRAIRIPTDPGQAIEIVSVEKNYESLADAIGNGCRYVERFRCPLTPQFNLVGVCDEDGQFSPRQPDNQRAWPLYPMPDYTLKGAVLVMQEGMTPEGPDFVDLADPELTLGLVAELLERSTR